MGVKNMENLEDTYQLSPIQHGMLFHSVYTQRSGVDIQQMVCTLPENLNISAFKQAWERVVERHTALRTSFRWEGLNEPLQDVHRLVTLPFGQQDWQHMSPHVQQRQLEVYLQCDRKRGFDLATAPLMRLALFRVGEAEYQCIWTFHHIVVDGRSQLAILKEVFAWYEAFCQARNMRLQQPRPYGDYIQWLQEQDLSKGEAFWRQTLKGFTAPTALSVVQAPGRAGDQEEDHGEQDIRLSVATTSALQSLAQHHQLTLNTLVQGAWVLLLSRYTGEEDVVFGVVRAGRRSLMEGAESMVGMFINTLPLRVHVPPEASLLPWLRELRAQNVAVREYEHTPLVKVQAWSDVPRGRPLFESILVFDNYLLNSTLRAQGGSWEKRQFWLLAQTNYPLTVYGYVEPALLLKIAYDRQRFDDTAVTQMLRHLKVLLEGIAAHPEQRLVDLPVLTDAERHQVLVAWNDTRRDDPNEQCLHQLFEGQVAWTPDAVAVMCEDAQLTYRELNRRANQLAKHLRRLGVGPEVRVGMCMERSPEMVAGLLGILKAGGAYVPLDPTYPRERLAFMLADAQVEVLLTQERLTHVLPEYRARVIYLEPGWEFITQESEGNPASGVTAENLCYVLYTSGSMGRPKGVAMSHGSLSNLLSWQLQNLTFSRGVRTLQFASLSFDVSFQEIFSTLCSGGTLVLISQELQRDAVGLLHLLTDKGVERLFLPFVALQQLALAAEGQTPTPTSLREIITAGEQLQITQSIASLFGKTKECTLSNQYGPSESHVVTAFTLMGSSNDWPVLPPIGRPIANTQIYLLDRHLQPVPVGVPGELYVGGAGLARGYFNRPELTAEKFIPHPFGANPGARLYKTGDLARYRPDGAIEFLGRLDHQVKVRGYRIELGEIEAVLTQHTAVRESVVLAREDIPGARGLVAYIVPRQAPPPTTRELRSFLQAKLPNYMVPSTFVMLAALPLTPNGKVDRRALPAPDQERPLLEEAFVAPRTPVEEALAGIWADVLGLTQVGIHDNFFALGGHSLLATQVIARLQAAFQVEVLLRHLFEAPTVAELSQAIIAHEARPGQTETIARILKRIEGMSAEDRTNILQKTRKERGHR